MLVLTRKRGETIRIGEDVVVKVIQVGRGSVKIGIDAPAHLRVLRGELQVFNPPLAAQPFSVDDPPSEIDQFLLEFGDLFETDTEIELADEGRHFWSGCTATTEQDPSRSLGLAR